MQLDKSTLKEEGYTGEDLLDNNGMSKLEAKFHVIRQVLADGDMSFDDALAIYQVSESDFAQYIVRNIALDLNTLFSHASAKTTYSGFLAVIAEMYISYIAPLDDDSIIIQNHIQVLSEKIKSGKLAVK